MCEDPAGNCYEQTAGFVYADLPDSTRASSATYRRPDDDNPAAVAAAGRSTGPGRRRPPGDALHPQRGTGRGLSAPFNSWFTLFGQFFDHGLDLVSKGGSGTVFVPLQPDDPLYDAAGRPTNFMVADPGHRRRHRPDGDAHNNQTTPFVDQNQTYTSHPSHQVFLREYD